MDIDELMQKVEEAAKTRSIEETERLLVEAKIIDEDGNYLRGYIPKKAILAQQKMKQVS